MVRDLLWRLLTFDQFVWALPKCMYLECVFFILEKSKWFAVHFNTCPSAPLYTSLGQCWHHQKAEDGDINGYRCYESWCVSFYFLFLIWGIKFTSKPSQCNTDHIVLRALNLMLRIVYILSSFWPRKGKTAFLLLTHLTVSLCLPFQQFLMKCKLVTIMSLYIC